MTDRTLDELIDIARAQTPTPQDREAQRRSFAYGTAHIENDSVTRDMIDHEADRFAQG